MIKITFKNLASSELAREATEERILGLVEKFEDLRKSRIQVTLEMQNSPLQAGPDLFNVKVQIVGARYAGLRIE
jgi:ribosome-associated translation inhibitor RaiA